MIEYLRVAIEPIHFTGTDMKKLHIRIKDSRYPEASRDQLIESDELISFFDQIWDCAKSEVLKVLKEPLSPVPLQAPESPVSG